MALRTFVPGSEEDKQIAGIVIDLEDPIDDFAQATDTASLANRPQRQSRWWKRVKRLPSALSPLAVQNKQHFQEGETSIRLENKADSPQLWW
jgi:hypothetical protein